MTNVRISQPLKTNPAAHADLAGLTFSYEHGIFYQPAELPIIMAMLSNFSAGMPAIGIATAHARAWQGQRP